MVAGLGLTALKERSAQAVMEAAVEVVAATLGNPLCKVLELLPDRRALLLRAGLGWQEGLVGHGTVSAGLESQAGYTLLQGGPVVVQDLPSETRFSGPPLLHHHGVVSGMSTPIYTSLGPWGVIGTHDTEHHEYSRHDQDFIVAVANILGAAIERERHEQELSAAKVRLQQLDQMRARFLHNVAHELRTPLTPLIMQLQGLDHLLRHESTRLEPQEVLDGVQVARRSAQRLQRLVDDMVSLTKLQAESVLLERSRLDLTATVRESVEAYQAYASRHGLDLTFEADGPAWVEGDTEKLHQVLGVLLDNAIKFTAQGGTVRATVRRQGDFGVASIEDSGIGLLPEQVHVLFEPLAPAPAQTQTGLGFGLVMAKEIVEHHGGHIGAQSAGAGKGSTFWFKLRLVEGERLTEQPGQEMRR